MDVAPHPFERLGWRWWLIDQLLPGHAPVRRDRQQLRDGLQVSRDMTEKGPAGLARMTWIRTAWVDEGEGPYMIAAYDDVSADAWGGTPDFYKDAQRDYAPAAVRELIVRIPEGAVTDLFKVETVDAVATEAGGSKGHD